MDWATAFVSYFMFLKKIEPTTAYDAWLVFLGALNGFAIGGFGIKRVTDIDYQSAKNAQPPDQPQVTVQPPSTVVVNPVQPASPVPDVIDPPTVSMPDQSTNQVPDD